jgi:translation initiation factor 1
MAKKIPTDSAPTTLGHNPFGALQGLRGVMPDGPSSSPAPAPTPAPAKAVEFAEKVVVRHERKGHGGKTVTVVSGVLPAARDVLCAAMKKALGCGARVDGDDVVLQGELVDRAVAFVQARGAKKVVRGS